MFHVTRLTICVCLLFLTLVGCKPAPSGPETVSQSNPTDADQTRTGNIADTIKGQADAMKMTAEADHLPETVDDLKSFLARKETEQLRPKDAKDYYEIQRNRADASKKLLGLKIHGDQRFEVIRIRLDSLMRLVAVGDAQARIDIQKTISQYSRDRMPRVRQAVAVAGLISDYRRQSGDDPAHDSQNLIDAASEVAEEYPESFYVCKELGNLAEQMLQKNDRESWQKLANILIDAYQDSPDQTCKSYVRQLSAKIKAASTDLDLIVRQISKQQPGAFDNFRQAVTKLFSDSDISLSSIEPVVDSLRWLEISGLTVEALKANQIVNDTSKQIQNPTVRGPLTENCNRRETRLDMIGKPFFIAALSIRGNRFDWNGFSDGNPVVVVFWSPAEPASVEMVKRLSRKFESEKENGLKLLAVNTSSESDASSLFGDEIPDWEIVKGNPSLVDGPSEFIGMFGLGGVPHIVLVDRAGVVVALNPPDSNIESTIDELVHPKQE